MEARLAAGLEILGMALPAARRSSLVAFLMLLARWNRAYNLTAVREPMDMVARHLLDSLAVLPYLHGSRILDLGSGAGLPGMVLALADPERRWVLLDSHAKKTRFLTQVAIELRPGNVEVVEARAETYAPACPFATVIARAVAPLATVLRLARRLSTPGGRILVMKGVYPAAELAELPDEAALLARVHPLRVPWVGGERHLVQFDLDSPSTLRAQ